MNLPKINLPTFSVKIISEEEPIVYSPMTLKEEKILLLAKESNEIEQIVRSIKQIVSNCVQNQIDVDNLPLFDLELILINIISKSINDKFEFQFTDDETDEKINASINIEDIKVQVYEDHHNPIDTGDGVLIEMKYPNVDGLTFLGQAKDDVSKLNIITKLVKKIYINDSVYDVKNFSDEEIIQFVEGMTLTQLKKIEQFFTSMPTLKYEFKYKNSNGKDKSLVIEGVRSFFTYR